MISSSKIIKLAAGLAFALALPAGRAMAQTTQAQLKPYCVTGAKYTCFGLELKTVLDLSGGTRVTLRLAVLPSADVPGTPTMVDWARLVAVDLLGPKSGFGGSWLLSADPTVTPLGTSQVFGDLQQRWFTANVGEDAGNYRGYELFTPYTAGGAEIVGCTAPPDVALPYVRTCADGGNLNQAAVEFTFNTAGAWSASQVGVGVKLQDSYGQEFSCLIAGSLYDDATAYHCKNMAPSTNPTDPTTPTDPNTPTTPTTPTDPGTPTTPTNPTTPTTPTTPTNHAPVAVLAPIAGAVNEGSSVTLNGAGSSDADGDLLTYAWTFGDGSPAQSTSASSIAHTYADNGTYAATLVVTDRNGGVSNVASISVVVTNVAPRATFNAPSSVAEGSAIALSLTSPVDPSSADVASGFTYAFNCGDGRGFGSFAAAASVSCATADNGTRTVGARIRDKDAGVTEYTMAVNVTSVAPTATFVAPTSVAEGTAIALSLANATDVSAADVTAGFTYAFDCGTGYGAWSATASASCATTDNGSRTVRGKLRDKDGAEREMTATVNVTNVAPTLAALNGPSSIEAGNAITLTAPFTDPGSADTFTSTIDWGDGTKTTGAATSPVSATHTYSVPGSFTVHLTVADDDGGVSNEVTHAVTVAAPPETSTSGHAFAFGSFVSPTGAFVDQPSLTGSVNFGFSVGFSRKTGKPVGISGFELALDGTHFVGHSIDSLTITANTATFSGTATWNSDHRVYRFRVTVIDGHDGTAGAGDKVRIQGWRVDDDHLVYDSQLGADANAPPSQPLTRGNIAIVIAKP